MKDTETKELIESLGDYSFIITECATSLENYMQMGIDQDERIKQLKAQVKEKCKRITELEESCQNMCDVETNLHNKIEKLEDKIKLLRGLLI